MGKYSLDAFEQHPLTKLRPETSERILGSCRILELHWSELEPEEKNRLLPPEIGPGKVLLRLHLDQDRDLMAACGFIRRIGACYCGGKGLEGVILTAGSFSGAMLGQLVRAYAQGFESTFLLAEPGTELMDRCRKEEICPGLFLPLAKGILPLRLCIARGNLERTWRNRPVYLEAGRALNDEELDAAQRWHVSGADIPAPLGPRMTLRRMMFPRDLTAGGVMPLRMWWQNLGTAPMYRDVHVVLTLEAGTTRVPITVPATMRPGLGDTTLNITAQLPQVPAGTYGLWVGLETDGQLLPLLIDAPPEQGMYRIGEVTLDHENRPYLAVMWEDQYADGYYPLEDPAQPE